MRLHQYPESGRSDAASFLSFGFLSLVLVAEPRGIHILVFLRLESAELVGERQGEIPAVRVLAYFKPLASVIYLGIGRCAVEQVVARQAEFGFLVGRSPFQSGIQFPDG